ncbi:MAG: DUF3299 domain-containing protein [Woeseiaceae bacterium]|nr:DUF3299 domain-containing protein [Woeseiaceae bacterium]
MKSLNRAIGSGIVLATMLIGLSFADEARELTWDDLIPAGALPQEPVYLYDHDELADDDWNEESLEKEFSTPTYSADVVDELNGVQAKLPGFVVPLELSGAGKVKEFLLVPYFGACIHYPPPPANQIVYVKLDKPVEIESPWDPIWATGELKTETYESDFVAAGYTMAAKKIEEYVY